MSAEAAARKGIPDATVSRLPTYLRALTALTVSGTTVVSSDELSALVGVGSAKLRKDLSHLGTYGVRGVGYDVERLTGEISLALGLTREWTVAIIGMGNLGRALAAYGGFANRGFTVIAAFDRDSTLLGAIESGIPVRPMANLAAVVRAEGLAIGVIATSPEGAQEAADALVSAGVRAILNFASTVITTPSTVTVRGVDLATELQILAFHALRRAAPLAAVDAGSPAGGPAAVSAS